jgi:large repetitive protein
MSTGRETFTATLLLDGRVLIAGGRNSAGIVDSAEIYEPATGRFTGGLPPLLEIYNPTTRTFTGAENLSIPRYYHTSTVLLSGKTAIIGGIGVSSSVVATAEVIDAPPGMIPPTSPRRRAARQ